MKHTWFAVLMFLGAACGGDSEGGPDAAAVAQADAAPAPSSPDAAPPAPDAAPPGPDAAPGQTANLTGAITRSAEPQNGGVGNIYVAVFANNPISDMSQAPVARALIEDVDMTASDASVAYTVPDVPVRGEPYHVVAFLDDNGTVDPTDPSAAGPDMGDLITMNGLAVPTVTVTEPGAVELDLVLSFAFPF